METTIQIHGLHNPSDPPRRSTGSTCTCPLGRVPGLPGPDGAGKSTTIRILLGLMRKNAGEARLFDGDPWDHAVRLYRRLAHVPDDVRLWPTLTGRMPSTFWGA